MVPFDKLQAFADELLANMHSEFVRAQGDPTADSGQRLQQMHGKLTQALAQFVAHYAGETEAGKQPSTVPVTQAEAVKLKEAELQESSAADEIGGLPPGSSNPEFLEFLRKKEPWNADLRRAQSTPRSG